MSITPSGPRPRASDADRERIAEQLREATTVGRLELDELAHRLDLVYAAKTVDELEALTADLGLPTVAKYDVPELRRHIRRKHRTEFLQHLGAYAGVNGGLIGFWAAGGFGAFWPRWPMIGWGMGLAIHATKAIFGLGVDEEVQQELRRRERRAREIRCPSCDRRMRPAGRVFVCKQCGRTVDAARVAPFGPAPAAPPTPLSRWVAVLFTDIVDSTKLNEAMGDHAWSEVRVRHAGLVRELIARHAGAELSNHGDGFAIRFDSAPEAAECAVAVQRALDAQRSEAGFAPTVRMGLHAGEAIDREGEVMGRVLNLASRVMAEAAPGEIVVTEPVADLLDDRFAVRDLGLRTLKGLSRPRHLLAVDWR